MYEESSARDVDQDVDDEPVWPLVVDELSAIA